MLRIGVRTEDMVTTRFAANAVWETTGSLHCVAWPHDHLLHEPLRSRVPPRPDFDLPLLLALARLRRFIPDTLSPVPDGTAHDAVAQLEAVRDTDRETVNRDLERIREQLPTLARMSAEEFLDRTATALLGWWRAVLEPLWERVIVIAEADIAHHHAALAEAGLAHALSQLDDGIRYADGAVWVDVAAGRELDVQATGLGLWFVPSVFRWPRLAVNHDADRIVVCYPARGAGLLWERPSATPAPLGDVIGRTRQRILDALDVPRSTTALAADLGLSPATVSGHLGVMTASGLLRSHRSGRLVLYSRTPVGEVLVTGQTGAPEERHTF